MLIHVPAVSSKVHTEHADEGRDRENHDRVAAREERAAEAAKPRLSFERVARQVVDRRKVIGIGAVPQAEREDREGADADHAVSAAAPNDGGCEKA